MKITRITSRAICLPRDIGAATGTAGTPTAMGATAGDYRWSAVYPCLYSPNFETALVQVETDAGLTGWGEAQAPLAPQVAATIVDRLLGPALVGEDFSEPTPGRIAALWQRMYSTMRVRGQTGGFMLDAIAGVDLALWDIAGQAAGQSVAQLITSTPKTRIPAYRSGMRPGETDSGGFPLVKMFYDTPGPSEFLAHVDAVQRTGTQVAVDALWRHTPDSALAFGRELDARSAVWFEAPLPPEDVADHAALAQQLRTPIGLGESYRTRFEMKPFFAAKALGVFQPDLGRTGITEGLRLAAMAAAAGVPVVPHLSIAFGPQVAAALQFAAAVPNCNLAEYNPQVLTVANRFLVDPIEVAATDYLVPAAPGLGIRFRETP